MNAPVITYQVAHRAAWDAGNRSAARNGREAWNLTDMAVAVREFERLYGPPAYANAIIQPKGEPA